MSTKPTVTAALIGCGGIAQSQHLPNLARSRVITLKTVCDVNDGAAEEAQRAYGVPQVETDSSAVMADPEIDLVIVATKEDFQVPLTCQALAAGKHVYVEKPLASTPAECAEVVAARERSGKIVHVGLNRRFAPACRDAAEVLQRHGGATNIYARIADAYWDWGKKNPPGIRVIHEVCHVFDLLRWLTQSEVESVYCACGRPDDEIYTLKFKSGCVATIMNSGQVTWDLPKERVEIVTRDPGAVLIEEFVELRTFGWLGEAPRKTYAGHTHPGSEFTHAPLFEKLGAAALEAFRRARWEMRLRAEAGVLDATSPEVAKFMQESFPHVNYLVDKGWRAALDHTANCILGREKFVGAGPEDALAASQIAQVAIQSRESGEVVRL